MISTCPNCQRLIAIPTGVPAAAAVRCPLCDAAYALSEALALLPPELIPVSATDAAARPAEDAHDAPPAMEAETAAADKAAAADAAAEAAPPAGELAPEAQPAAGEQAGEEAELAGPHEEPNEAAGAAAGAHPLPSATLQRQRRGPSGLRRLIETLIGALVGVLIAYYAWAICLGPRKFNEEVIQRFGLPRLPFISAPAEPPAK